MAERLYRSTDDAMVAGVVSGVAEYYRIDVTLLRLVWLVAAFFNGIGLLAYVAAWLLIPQRPGGTHAHFEDAERLRERVVRGAKQVEESWRGGRDGAPWRVIGADGGDHERRRAFVGVILVALGVLALGSEFGWWVNVGRFWPIVLIVVGVALAVRGWRDSR